MNNNNIYFLIWTIFTYHDFTELPLGLNGHNKYAFGTILILVPLRFSDVALKQRSFVKKHEFIKVEV